MTSPKPKVRKVAWVVLGVVGAAILCCFVTLSTSYTEWALDRSTLPGDSTMIYRKSRLQKLPWLPGADEQVVVLDRQTYETLRGVLQK